MCRKGLLGAHFGERLEQLPTEQTLVMEVTPTTINNIDCRRLQAWAGGALGEMEAGWPTPGPPAPTLIFKAVRHQHHLWPRNEEEQQLIFASPSGQTPTSSLAGKRGGAAAHLCLSIRSDTNIISGRETRSSSSSSLPPSVMEEEEENEGYQGRSP